MGQRRKYYTTERRQGQSAHGKKTQRIALRERFGINAPKRGLDGICGATTPMQGVKVARYPVSKEALGAIMGKGGNHAHIDWKILRMQGGCPT